MTVPFAESIHAPEVVITQEHVIYLPRQLLLDSARPVVDSILPEASDQCIKSYGRASGSQL